MSFKVTCPSCRSTLKSDKPIRAGKQLTCPQCRTPFQSTGSVADDGIQAGAAPVSAAPVAYRPYGAPAGTGPAAGATTAVADVALAPASGGSKAMRALIVAGIFLGIAGVGAGTLYLILGRSDSSPGDSPDTVRAPLNPNPENDEQQRLAKILAEVNTQERKPLIVLTPEEDADVLDMTKKAVAWVRKSQKQNGLWGDGNGNITLGMTAMAALTLLECGAAPDDPAVVKALEALRPHLKTLNHTYSLALMILLLEKLNNPADKDTLETLALRLASGQTPRGAWGYTTPVLTENETLSLKDVLVAMKMRSREDFARSHKPLLDKLPSKLQLLACLRTISERPDDYKVNEGDNSNTQFAMLALWAARRKGVPVERSLRLVANHFKHSQNPNGMWAYHYPNQQVSSRPTMTCAGLVGMAISYGLEDNPSASVRNDPQILKGLSIISSGTRTRKKGGDQPEMYYLWSVERVAVLFQLNKINDMDWYRWGMDLLREKQHKEGYWHIGVGAGAGPLTDTLFALLFLQRVNLAQDLTDKIRDDVPWIIPNVAGKD